jgi:hypothetical protein
MVRKQREYRLTRPRFLPFNIEVGTPPVSFDGPCGIHCGRGMVTRGAGFLNPSGTSSKLVKDSGIHCGHGCCHGRRFGDLTETPKPRQPKKRWWER